MLLEIFLVKVGFLEKPISEGNIIPLESDSVLEIANLERTTANVTFSLEIFEMIGHSLTVLVFIPTCLSLAELTGHHIAIFNFNHL